MELETLLGFARELALAGGDEAMRAYGGPLDSRRKNDGSWVTHADESVEKNMRALIAARFPEHNVLGEEEGLLGASGGPSAPGAPTWVLDPIDGTHNFMVGIPIWATLVGLEVDGELVIGAVHAPALGESYDAARGLGARMNGEAISVSDISSIEDAMVVSTGFEGLDEAGLGEFYLSLTRRSNRSRGLGDFWGHMLVARGAADVMVEPILSTWDYAALVPIVEEAGGRLTQLNGDPMAHGSTSVSSNGHLHDDVLALAAST